MKKNYFFLIIFFFLFSFSYSQITSFPHTTTFENASDISTTASDVNSKWVTRTDGDWSASELYWTRLSGSTPSSTTGPSSGYGGSGYYVYVESSHPAVSGNDAELSANYNFSGKTEASISFNYHNYGASYGPADMGLYVYNVTDSQWSSALWENSSSSNSWQSQTVDLSAYDGKSVQIWFTLNINGYYSDGALDNIEVTAYTPNGVTDYYVDDNGDDTNNGLTEGAPFATLAKALSVSDDGTGVTINVGAGTYTEEDLTISRSNITISGAGSGQTIFDGDLDGRFATISANNTTIQNLQIKEYGVASSCTTNGSCGGGAILLSSSVTGLTVNDIIFDGNVTDGTSGDGGVIELLSSSTATFNSCIFRNNRAGATNAAESGKNGGVAKTNGSNTLTFNNCLFHENIAKGLGPVYGSWNASGTATFTNCTMYANVAYNGNNGFSYVWQGTVNLRNSIVRNTMHGGSSGIDLQYITGVNVNYGSKDADAANNTLTGTNSTSDPQFTDAANDDYTLQTGSPAIDAGSSTYAPADDINDFSRPQGQADDIGAYEHRNTWDGSTDTDWSTSANWSENIVPVAGRSPIIADVTNQPVISSDDGSSGDVTLEDITINSGAELTINKEASLTLTDDFTNNSGSVYLESDSNEFASIIVQGDASGNITYKRYVNGVTANGWDLIGSPVDGLDINTFVSANSGVLATNGVQVAVGTFNNSNNDWSNYTTDGSGAGNINAAGNFDIGKGYQMGTVDGGSNILQFTGTIATADQLQAVINNQGNGDGRRWNLIANPFPSYLMLNDDAHASNNLLTVNNSIIDGNYLAAYGYDADGSGFTAYGQDFNSNTAKYVAPGQAFMVAASSSSSTNLSVTEAMLTTTGSDDFISGDNMDNTEIYLKLYNGDQMIETTHIKFQENMTLGLDPGYDLGNYYQAAAISTRLVEDDEGNNFEHQQLPPSSMENAVIPLVINQSAGQEFRINLHTATIPDPNVYLEDVEEGTFTNLYEEDFVYTPTSDLSGVGRFFIHMTADTMSNEEVTTSMLNAYKEVNANYITLEGLATQSNNINVSLYNILGRKVLDTSLSNNMNTQTISTLGMAAGIYVIELESGSDRLTKKLIIQ